MWAEIIEVVLRHLGFGFKEAVWPLLKYSFAGIAPIVLLYRAIRSPDFLYTLVKYSVRGMFLV